MPLTRDRIVAQGLRVVEARGLDALTLRGVAHELGVTPMALYRHVDTHEHLVDLVVEQLLAGAAEEVTAWPGDWQTCLRLTARLLHDMLAQHPIVLAVVSRRPVAGPAALAHVERLVAALARAGMDEQAAVDVYANVLTYVTGYVSVNTGRVAARQTSGVTLQQQRDQVRNEVASLAPEEFPIVVRNADAVASLVDEGHFRSGIERIVSACEAEVGSRLHTTAGS